MNTSLLSVVALLGLLAGAQVCLDAVRKVDKLASVLLPPPDVVLAYGCVPSSKRAACEQQRL